MNETRSTAEGQATVQIFINGEARPVLAGITLDALIAELGFEKDKVAVEYNRGIVRRPRWHEVHLADGDRLEIVHFVGGG